MNLIEIHLKLEAKIIMSRNISNWWWIKIELLDKNKAYGTMKIGLSEEITPHRVKEMLREKYISYGLWEFP